MAVRLLYKNLNNMEKLSDHVILRYLLCSRIKCVVDTIFSVLERALFFPQKGRIAAQRPGLSQWSAGVTQTGAHIIVSHMGAWQWFPGVAATWQARTDVPRALEGS